MLAMEANDNAGCLVPRGVWSTIAGKPAPTGGGVNSPLRHKKAPHRQRDGGLFLAASGQTLTIQPAGASMSPVCTPVSSL